MVVFSLTGWSPRIHAEFLVLRTTQVPSRPDLRFRLQGCHLLWLRFPADSSIFNRGLSRRSFNPGGCLDNAGLGSCAFARHYLRNHFCFLFLRVLRCFSSPGSPHAWRDAGPAAGGLPHSEIRASKSICLYARLIAACHVLRRLQEPRHPSCALFSFPFSFLKGRLSHNTSVTCRRVRLRDTAACSVVFVSFAILLIFI